VADHSREAWVLPTVDPNDPNRTRVPFVSDSKPIPFEWPDPKKEEKEEEHLQSSGTHIATTSEQSRSAFRHTSVITNKFEDGITISVQAQTNVAPRNPPRTPAGGSLASFGNLCETRE
jgi:hypothetical protein